LGVDQGSGEPLLSRELTLSAKLEHLGRKKDIALRGQPGGPRGVREISLTQGSWDGAGKKVMVGRQLARAMRLAVGDEVKLAKETWTVAFSRRGKRRG